MSLLVDGEVVQLVVDGNEDAFAELYHRYSRDVYNYLLRMVPNQAAAEDLLQETFVAVWQGLCNFKSESSVKTWFFRIAHNKAMSWMRANYRYVEVAEEKAQEVEEALTATRQPLLNWRADIVEQALSELSPNHRAVIELFYFLGLSYNEIAQVVNCPVGTVKSRMSYALQNLNGILTNYGVDS